MLHNQYQIYNFAFFFSYYCLFTDIDLPFDKMLASLGDFDNDSNELFMLGRENQELATDSPVVVAQMGVYMDRSKLSENIIINHSLGLSNIDVDVKNIKLEDKDELDSNFKNSSFRRKSKILKNSPDLQYKKKICSNLLLKRNSRGNT